MTEPDPEFIGVDEAARRQREYEIERAEYRRLYPTRDLKQEEACPRT